MPKLPQVNARRLVAALKRGGFVVCRQTGSHVFLHQPVTRRTTVVPAHAKTLKPELVAGILKQAGISEDEFLDLLS